MTKEEIIRNLKYTMEKHKNDTVSTFDTNISVMCKDILDYLEQESKMEWIPVSERLPEKNVWVLVTVEQNDNRYQEIMRRNVYTGEWTDNIDNYTNEITAWMPLPEPYKAE